MNIWHISKIKKVLIWLNKLIALMHLFKCFKCKLSEIKVQIKEKNTCHK
jgi:hypothetical protein